MLSWSSLSASDSSNWSAGGRGEGREGEEGGGVWDFGREGNDDGGN